MSKTAEKPKKRVFATRVAGQPRHERKDLWRYTLEAPIALGERVEAEVEISGEYKSDILRVAIERELKRRDKARAKKNSAVAA